MTTRRVPLSTYRLQLGPSFGFAAASEVAPYLSSVGVSHVYLSPVLQAAPGSTHGYDVVDHSHASDDLGGEAAFRSMVAAFRSRGLGVVLDVVPNHMAAALPHNRWWWDVLENGPASFWASFFDIDWDPPEAWLRNRVLLPVLGARYGRALDDLRVVYDGRSFVVRYFEHVFPVAPRSLDGLVGVAARSAVSPELEFIASALGSLPLASATDRASVRRRHRDKGVLLDRVATLYAGEVGVRQAIDASVDAVNASPADLDELLERQNYRLAFWRTADQQVDYRRFFDIDTLVALRVEDEEVFEETHAQVFAWVRDGLVDGLRIDHIDGLASPERYLTRLASRTDGAWVVVEKVLEAGETLPASWPVAGTTGYDFLNAVTKLFVDPAGKEPLDALWRSVSGSTDSPDDVIRTGKELMLDTGLGADLNRVVERLLRLTEQTRALRDATRAEVHAAVRGLAVAFPVYRSYGGPASLVEGAAAVARDRDPSIDEDVMAFVVDVLLGRVPGGLDVSRRFEQLTGPVMAKGVEDTAFYRYHRLITACEVGSDLRQWSCSVEEWHARCATGGGSMLATSTHDTKRSEDVRTRVVLLSEAAPAWERAARRWLSRPDLGVDAATRYLLLQTFVGAWPLPVDRAVAYAAKATHEAKLHTSWTDPDAKYDAAVEAWVRGMLADDRFVEDLATFVSPLVEPGRRNSLAMTLAKLAAPGVPDIYQGTEVWDLSLVDPDNRRPVDFAALERSADHPKLRVIRAALGVRQRRPDCFDAGAPYQPLEVTGPASDHAVAWARGGDVVAVIPRLVLGLDAWGATSVAVPDGAWRDVVTGSCVSGGPVPLESLLTRFPVALLERS